MKSVFFKSYVVLVILMFLSMFATLLITDNLLEDVDTANFITDATTEYRLLIAENKSGSLNEDVINRYMPTFDVELFLQDNSSLPEKFKKLLPIAASGVFTGLRHDPWTYIIPVPEQNKVILFAETGTGFSDVPRDDWLEFLLPIGTLFIVMGLGIFYLARKLINPINHLSEVAAELGQGNYAVRVNEESAKPLSILATNFNEMADRTGNLIREQEIIIGALPHELRTPLAKARFALDVTRNKNTLSELKEQIELVDSSIDELDRMIQSTLQITRLHHPDEINYLTLNLTETIHACIADTENPKQHDLRLSLHDNDNSAYMVNSNESLLCVSISNLLRNALRHASTIVSVSITEASPEFLTITVEDDGDGIPVDKRIDIFTPFYRLDESRNRDTGGMGLGLSMVKLITDKLKLTITADEGPLGGARLVIAGIHKAPSQSL